MANSKRHGELRVTAEQIASFSDKLEAEGNVRSRVVRQDDELFATQYRSEKGETTRPRVYLSQFYFAAEVPAEWIPLIEWEDWKHAAADHVTADNRE